MREHFSIINDAEFNSLKQSGISDMDLLKSIPEFRCDQAPASKVSLMYFIDSHGDFEGKKDTNSLIANGIFNSLTVREKIEIGEYLNWYEEGQDE